MPVLYGAHRSAGDPPRAFHQAPRRRGNRFRPRLRRNHRPCRSGAGAAYAADRRHARRAVSLGLRRDGRRRGERPVEPRQRARSGEAGRGGRPYRHHEKRHRASRGRCGTGGAPGANESLRRAHDRDQRQGGRGVSSRRRTEKHSSDDAETSIAGSPLQGRRVRPKGHT